MELFDRGFDELSTLELHAILRARVDVFVVEQHCAYPEVDGRDTAPTTRHVWLADDAGLCAYLRVLVDGDDHRIGRVLTVDRCRGHGHASTLLEHALTTAEGPWVLDAQSHLEGWYTTHGFVVDGPSFVEDGIPHVPMRRD